MRSQRGSPSGTSGRKLLSAVRTEYIFHVFPSISKSVLIEISTFASAPYIVFVPELRAYDVSGFRGDSANLHALSVSSPAGFIHPDLRRSLAAHPA